MFASMAWMEIAGSLLGAVIEDAIFAATFNWMKNLVFMLNAGMYFLTTLLTVYVTFFYMHIFAVLIHHIELY